MTIIQFVDQLMTLMRTSGHICSGNWEKQRVIYYYKHGQYYADNKPIDEKELRARLWFHYFLNREDFNEDYKYVQEKMLKVVASI